jgi:hypothetical protein
MTDPRRLSPQEVRRALLEGGGLLLVCAYEEDRRFEAARLEGAIPFSDYLARRAFLTANQDLVFYCG